MAIVWMLSRHQKRIDKYQQYRLFEEKRGDFIFK